MWVSIIDVNMVAQHTYTSILTNRILSYSFSPTSLLNPDIMQPCSNFIYRIYCYKCMSKSRIYCLWGVDWWIMKLKKAILPMWHQLLWHQSSLWHGNQSMLWRQEGRKGSRYETRGMQEREWNCYLRKDYHSYLKKSFWCYSYPLSVMLLSRVKFLFFTV